MELNLDFDNLLNFIFNFIGLSKNILKFNNK